ncbi:YopB/SseC family type III secretion system translocon subunit, partial [Salmonella enterica subsp. enterica serovar Bredeney]|nr:YopB/SseC family type III secretion system translocon subunit [Salmonella enterica subsp. enterica serovar Bredeney]
KHLLHDFDVKLHILSEHLLVLLQKENEKHEDKLTYVMALIAKLIDENSRDELESAAKVREKLSEAAARDATKKAKEFAAQERKAEHLQKTMGCIGKIIGAVITVVGVAAAAF